MDVPCVGAIIRDATGRLLVVRRGRPPSKGLWSIPGGRIETGESPVDAVRREVHEETGLDVEVASAAGSVELPALHEADRYLVTDYLATVSRGSSTVPRAGDDAADARWVTHDEFLVLHLTPGLAAALDSWGVWG